MCEQFTTDAEQVVGNATEQAWLHNHGRVNPVDLLLALVWEPAGVPARVLGGLGVTPAEITTRVESLVRPEDHVATRSPAFADATTEILEQAAQVAYKMGWGFAKPEHILIALVDSGDDVVVAVLDGSQVSPETVREAVRAVHRVPVAS